MPRYSSAAWRAYRPDSQRAAPSASAPAAGDCLILGLDPGSRRTGYGLVQLRAGQPLHVAHGCIDVSGARTADRAGGLAARLRQIYEAVSELVVTHRPAEIAIERVFLHKNADSALKLGQARGVALCAAIALGAAAHEYAPRAIKQAVTGYGGAEKGQVGHMIALLLQLDTAPAPDAADALAIALCHAQSRRLAALLGHGA
jgi:crossover junction endodeoxyribonuclease RuvC